MSIRLKHEARNLIWRLKALGYEVGYSTRGNHLKLVVRAKGRRVKYYTSTTTSDRRAYKNALSDIKRQIEKVRT